MAATSRVWTPAEIAELTRTAIEDVVAEMSGGRLRGFRIGPDWRVTDAALQSFMNGEVVKESANGSDADDVRLEDPHKLDAKIEWKPMKADFTYTWPNGETKETFDTAFEATVALSSGNHRFVIGYTVRKAAGMKNRKRIIVFLGQSQRLVPMVEFAGSNDFERTHRVASMIKGSSNERFHSPSQLPPEYRGMPTVVYSDLVIGPYAARSLAVLADYDDRDLMLRHAIIRATYKGLI